MSDILRRAKDHFAEQKNRTVQVPEWGEPAELGPKGEVVRPAKPLVIHFDSMTMRERRKIYEKAAKNDLSASVDVLILMAKDGHGNKLFSEDNRHELMTAVDPVVIGRIASEILASPEFTPESAEKNSAPTVSS